MIKNLPGFSALLLTSSMASGHSNEFCSDVFEPYASFGKLFATGDGVVYLDPHYSGNLIRANWAEKKGWGRYRNILASLNGQNWHQLSMVDRIYTKYDKNALLGSRLDSIFKFAYSGTGVHIEKLYTPEHPILSLTTSVNGKLYQCLSGTGPQESIDMGRNWSITNDKVNCLDAFFIKNRIIGLSLYDNANKESFNTVFNFNPSTKEKPAYSFSGNGLLVNDVIIADSDIFINTEMPKAGYLPERFQTYLSSDYGKTWRRFSFPEEYKNMIPSVIGYADGVLYAGTYLGLIESSDLGNVWRPSGNGIPAPNAKGFINDMIHQVIDGGKGATYAISNNAVYRKKANGDWGVILKATSKIH